MLLQKLNFFDITVAFYNSSYVKFLRGSGVLSCIPLPSVKYWHRSVRSCWFEMLVTSIFYQPLYLDSLLQQLGQSCPSLAQPLSRPMQTTAEGTQTLTHQNRSSDGAVFRKWRSRPKQQEHNMTKIWLISERCVGRRGFGRLLCPARIQPGSRLPKDCLQSECKTKD